MAGPAVTTVCRLMLVRQGIAHRLECLGAAVTELGEAPPAVDLALVRPDVVSMDVEDEPFGWAALVEPLRAAAPRLRGGSSAAAWGLTRRRRPSASAWPPSS